jgi:hypothetical protein
MAATPIRFGVPIDMEQLEILRPRMEQLAEDPDSPQDGMYWYNTAEGIAKICMAGTVVLFYSQADADKLAGIDIVTGDISDQIQELVDEITAISSDNILSMGEKPAVKLQYDTIIAEQDDIDSLATAYGVTTEKVAYDNAITALTAYITGLNPLYTDFTQNTTIVGATFRNKFSDVYSAKSALLTRISNLSKAEAATTLGIAEAAQAAADQAAIDAATALASIEGASDDGILTPLEKPEIVKQYHIIQGEFTGILDQADSFGITTSERDNYYDAVNALSVYIDALDPTIDDYTQATIIVRATFNSAFELYFSTRQILLNKIAAVAKETADTAAIIAASKKRHFVAEPTTPYEIGDLWSNAVDLYRCIVTRLTGAFNMADWEVATHYDKTKTIIDGGLVTTGRIEVGGGILGANNAGMNGAVSGTPATDIRFWAGADYANRNTAPWRVQNDGTFYATQGFVGGWHIDTDSMHTGTKKTGDGFSAAPGDITIRSDGSIHAKNFYINADGEVSFTAIDSNIETIPDTTGTYKGSIKMSGNQMWENNRNGDDGGIYINYKGYNGGVTKKRYTAFGNGKGATVMQVGAAEVGGVEQPYGGIVILGILDLVGLPTSDAGLGAGQVYRDGAGSGAVLKII